MPEADGQLTPEDLDKLNEFLGKHSPDEALTCPVTGERVPIKDWNAPDGVLQLSGATPYAAVPLTSPAGGVILLSVLKLGL